jgi:CubicO group peptidase (beta-lactamase class C family)
MRKKFLAFAAFCVLLVGAALASAIPGVTEAEPATRASAAELTGQWSVSWKRDSGRSRSVVGVLTFRQRGAEWDGDARIAYGFEGSVTYAIEDVDLLGKNLTFALNAEGGGALQFTAALSETGMAGEVRYLAEDGSEHATSFTGRRGLPERGTNRTGDVRLRVRNELAGTGLDVADVSNVILAAEMTRSHALVIVWDGEVVVAEGFGHDLRAMPLYSVTKPIAALAIALLVDAGVIGLDDPVSRWIRDFADGTRQGVTVRHVLAHTSGLAPGETTVLNRAEDRVAYARNARLLQPPGSAYTYNNRAFQLLSGIVRVATGGSLADYVREHIFARLGIGSAAWPADIAGESPAYAGLRMHPFDLATLGAVLADGGRFQGLQVVPKEWLAEICSPASPDGTPMGGGGWKLRRSGGKPNSRPIGFGHSGDGGQFLLVYPSARLVGVRLIGWQERPEENALTFGSFGRMMDDLAIASAAARVKASSSPEVWEPVAACR